MKTKLAVLILVCSLASVAYGQRGGGPMPGGAFEGMGGMGAMHPVVLSNGSVIVQKTTPPTAASGAKFELVAISSTGATLWTKEIDRGAHSPTLAGNLLLFVELTAPARPGDGIKSNVVALNAASGVEAWRLAVDGSAMSIAPAENQIYVVTVSGPGGMHRPTGSGGPMMPRIPPVERTLIAISLTGSQLWSLSLGN
jgi:hypothetical protein